MLYLTGTRLLPVWMKPFKLVLFITHVSLVVSSIFHRPPRATAHLLPSGKFRKWSREIKTSELNFSCHRVTVSIWSFTSPPPRIRLLDTSTGARAEWRDTWSLSLTSLSVQVVKLSPAGLQHACTSFKRNVPNHKSGWRKQKSFWTFCIIFKYRSGHF